MYDINFDFPIAKVDQSRRVITGVATADNIDPSGDIIDFDASLEAFDNWVGNIREMHQPKSVGKSLTYRPVKVPYQGGMYDGIEVEAYISKGAEDTWQKVLDGTLRGFSVGGKTLQKVRGYDKFSGRGGNRVTKYFLGELSLVDNPGNPAATLSLIKRAEDGGLEYALAKYDVFFCQSDKEASLETDICPSCAKPMKNIGEVATPDAAIIRKFAADYVNNYKPEWINEDLIKVRFAGSQEPIEQIKEIKMEKLLNNNVGDNVADMDLTPEQEDSILAKFRTALFGKPITSTLEATASPVVVNINVGEELAKASSVAKPRGAAPAAKNDSAAESSDGSATAAAGGEADEDEEDVNGEKVKQGVKADGSAAKTLAKKAGSTVPADDEDKEDAMDGEDDEAAEGESPSGQKLKKDIGGDMDLDMFKDAMSAILDEKLTAVKEEISADVDAKIETIQKSVDATVEKVDNSGALKKSMDADEGDEGKLEKKASDSFWGGVFVPFEVASTLGYDS